MFEFAVRIDRITNSSFLCFLGDEKVPTSGRRERRDNARGTHPADGRQRATHCEPTAALRVDQRVHSGARDGDRRRTAAGTRRLRQHSGAEHQNSAATTPERRGLPAFEKHLPSRHQGTFSLSDLLNDDQNDLGAIR